jgi:hypothetical protein
MITLAFLLFFVKEGSGLFPDRQMPGLPVRVRPPLFRPAGSGESKSIPFGDGPHWKWNFPGPMNKLEKGAEFATFRLFMPKLLTDERDCSGIYGRRD